MALIPNNSRELPIGFIVIGFLLISINYLAEYFGDVWFPKLLLSGIAIIIIGVFMFIFPPVVIREAEPTKYLGKIIKESKKINVFMWALSIPVAIGFAIWFVIAMGYSL